MFTVIAIIIFMFLFLLGASWALLCNDLTIRLVSHFIKDDSKEEPKKKEKPNPDETFWFNGKERSKVTGNIVRRYRTSNNHYVLRDCKTGLDIYDYTADRLYKKLEENDAKARELGWGFYYGTQVRHGDYFYNRIEFLTGKEIETNAYDYTSHERRVYNIWRFTKRYVYEDKSKNSEEIDIGLKEFLSLAPRCLDYGTHDYRIMKPLADAGVIVNKGNSQFEINYEKEIRLYKNRLNYEMETMIENSQTKYFNSHIQLLNVVVQRELEDCKKSGGDDVINKMVSDNIIHVSKDEEGKTIYTINTDEESEKIWVLKKEYDEFMKKYYDPRIENLKRTMHWSIARTKEGYRFRVFTDDGGTELITEEELNRRFNGR